MTVSLTHSKIIVNKPATANTNDVDAVDWNEEHVLTLASGNVLGRTTAGTGAVEEISFASLAASGGFLMEWESRAAVALATIDADVDALRTLGYATPGDGGGALYKRVVAEPSHAGKVQSADGGWWELAEKSITPEMFGAAGDGTTDDAASVQAACNYSIATGIPVLPAPKVFRIESPVTIAGAVRVVGAGCSAFTDLDDDTPASSGTHTRGGGTWFHIAHTGIGFSIDGTSGSSDGVATVEFTGIGTFRTQPTPGAGAFTPTAHDFDFNVVDCEFVFDGWLLNPTKGINLELERGGRAYIKAKGQPLQKGIVVDKAYDRVEIDAHFWPYWSLNNQVRDYTLGNLIALETKRVDLLRITTLFSIYANKVWHVNGSVSGVANRAHVDLLYADNCVVGCAFSVDADAASVHFDSFVAYGIPYATYAASSYGYTTDCDNSDVTMSYCDFDNHYAQAIYMGGTGNRLQISLPSFKNFGLSNVAATPGTVIEAGNSLILDGQPHIVTAGAASLYSGAGNIETPDWRSYTPTITAGSGTFTSVSATGRFRKVGRHVDFQMTVSITTNGTAATNVAATLPFAVGSTYSFVGYGRENTTTGNLLGVTLTAGATQCGIINYDNTYPGADGYVLHITGSYEAA